MKAFTLSVMCTDDIIRHPYMMQLVVVAKDYDRAREIFLADPTIKQFAANDIVAVVSLADAPLNVTEGVWNAKS